MLESYTSTPIRFCDTIRHVGEDLSKCLGLDIRQPSLKEFWPCLNGKGDYLDNEPSLLI